MGISPKALPPPISPLPRTPAHEPLGNQAPFVKSVPTAMPCSSMIPSQVPVVIFIIIIITFQTANPSWES